jgi:hypothetical protein
MVAALTPIERVAGPVLPGELRYEEWVHYVARMLALSVREVRAELKMVQIERRRQPKPVGRRYDRATHNED